MVTTRASFDSQSPRDNVKDPQSTSPFKALAEETSRMAAGLVKNLKKGMPVGSKEEEVKFEVEVMPFNAGQEAGTPPQMKEQEPQGKLMGSVAELGKLVLARQAHNNTPSPPNSGASGSQGGIPMEIITVQVPDEDTVVAEAVVPVNQAENRTDGNGSGGNLNANPRNVSATATQVMTQTQNTPAATGTNLPSQGTTGGGNGGGRAPPNGSGGNGNLPSGPGSGGSNGPGNNGLNGPGGSGGNGPPPPPPPGGGGGSGGNGRNGPPPTDPFRPVDPIMGAVYKLSRDYHGVLMGGKPNANWTGLAEPNTRRHPDSWRYPYSSSESKNLKYRSTGIPIKLGLGNGDFKQWNYQLKEKLLDCGCDTVAYLQDPDDSTSMLFILDNYQRYDRANVQQLMKIQKPLYDAYDNINDKTGIDILCDSIDATLPRSCDEILIILIPSTLSTPRSCFNTSSCPSTTMRRLPRGLSIGIPKHTVERT